jgi:glycosyltransferase involved in cell wall biosynthesis
MMNLYLYLKHFPPYGDDLNEGTRKSVHGLAGGLAACGADVTVICEGTRDSVFQSDAGYTIRCFANPKSKESEAIANSASFTISPGLESFVQTQKKNSLFILNGIFHKSVYSFSRVLKKHSVPYIVAPHDPYHPFIFKKNAHLKLPYWHLLEKRVLQQAKAVQVLDQRHEEWLRRLGVRTPVIEVPNGFSPSDVHAESSLEWRTEQTARFFFLGRIDAYNKGLDLLIEAFARMEANADIQLTIQGPDWGDRQVLEAQVTKLGLAGKVKLLPPDYDRSPSAIIASHDVFCLSSRFEGFSLSTLEAMLAGRVVLISDIAGLAPHVAASGCGVVIQPEVTSIQAGLQQLLQRRSQWREMGLQGRDYALKHLQWNSIAKTALDHYSQLVA